MMWDEKVVEGYMHGATFEENIYVEVDVKCGWK